MAALDDADVQTLFYADAVHHFAKAIDTSNMQETFDNVLKIGRFSQKAPKREGPLHDCERLFIIILSKAILMKSLCEKDTDHEKIQSHASEIMDICKQVTQMFPEAMKAIDMRRVLQPQ